MKRKLKKLSLTTETLRSLTEPSLEKVAGGLTPVNCTTSDNTRACSLCTAACSVCCP
jgi:hypothetical protein